MNTKQAVSMAVAIALAFSAGAALAGKKGSGGSKASKGDYRSAKSGQYVKKGYADKNKNTTVREEKQKK